jgi:DNA excision repair protein ERCC-2
LLFPAVKTTPMAAPPRFLSRPAPPAGWRRKALDELRTRGLRLKSLTLTAKEKICFTPDGACNPE